MMTNDSELKQTEPTATTEVEVTSEAIDLLGNGKVVKTVLVKGQGDEPKPGTTVKVHYTGTLENGTKFDSSLDRKVPFEFELGAGRVIKGWEVAVASMKTGEKCRVVLQPDFAYGESGSPPTIPPSAVLVFEIELLSFSTRKEKWAMTADEKLTAAAESKQEGTSRLKEGLLPAAAAAYGEGVAMLEKLEDWAESQQGEAKELFVACNVNLALVQLKQENWLEAVIAASAALAVEPRNVKALYRRASARGMLDEFQLAEADVAAALALEPENSEVRRLAASLRNRRREADEAMKAMYARMF